MAYAERLVDIICNRAPNVVMICFLRIKWASIERPSRARVRGRARRRRPLEISEPRRRRLGVAGDDAVRRVDDARARRGPPAAAEGRVGERRVEVAVVAPPAFF